MATISRECGTHEHILYLNESSKIKVNPILFANIFISFTFVYDSYTSDTQTKWNFFEDGLHKYARRTSRTIDEKKILLRHDCNATFQGMERVIKCVDAYVNQLISIDNFNEYARYLIKQLFLINSYIHSEIIKLICWDNKKKTLNIMWEHK